MTPELTEEQQGVEVTSTTPSQEPVRSSPGSLIRRARERGRLTLEELAAQIKLPRGTLDALERDDFKMLMEPVYVRGYYRKCAKVLGIAEKDLVDAYESMVAPRSPEAPAKLRLASGSELGSGSRLPVALAAGAAIVGVVVLSVIWFARGEVNRPPALEVKTDAPVSVDTKVDATPADATATTGDAGSSTVPAATPADAPAATPAPAAPQASTAAPVAAAPAAAAATAPAAPAMAKPAAPAMAAPTPATPAAAAPKVVSVGNASITLRFTVTSWARVDDASGKTLVNGLVRAGEKQTYTSAAPFAVFLGNAPGVSVDVNGKAIDLTQYTKSNSTARFSAAP